MELEFYVVELDCWSSSSSNRGGRARALRQKKELELELGTMEDAKLDIGEDEDRNLQDQLIQWFTVVLGGESSKREKLEKKSGLKVKYVAKISGPN
uniref:Uncharacterized protein n=1 Tax=Oryza nivara TaxID=4536 RepID=A0A0E0HD84_ORYNI